MTTTPVGLSKDPATLLAAAGAGSRPALARLLTYAEWGGDKARDISRLAWARAGSSHTVGITGAPGAGKSTLTGRLIAAARAQQLTVGVLAVDPSSPFSGGAVLGDRVRMQQYAEEAGVFIRSMATRGHLGGLSLAAPLALRILDAAGFDRVLVETVGVGQAEIEIVGSADTTIVVLAPGWGDSVQANKAGIMEIADIFVVNKVDLPGASDAVRDIEQMLDLAHAASVDSRADDSRADDSRADDSRADDSRADDSRRGWRPPVIASSAEDGTGVDQLWATIEAHRTWLQVGDRLAERRAARLADEVRDIVVRRLEERAHELCRGPAFAELQAKVLARHLDPLDAADELVAQITVD